MGHMPDRKKNKSWDKYVVCRTCETWRYTWQLAYEPYCSCGKLLPGRNHAKARSYADVVSGVSKPPMPEKIKCVYEEAKQCGDNELAEQLEATYTVSEHDKPRSFKSTVENKKSLLDRITNQENNLARMSKEVAYAEQAMHDAGERAALSAQKLMQLKKELEELEKSTIKEEPGDAAGNTTPTSVIYCPQIDTIDISVLEGPELEEFNRIKAEIKLQETNLATYIEAKKQQEKEANAFVDAVRKKRKANDGGVRPADSEAPSETRSEKSESNQCNANAAASADIPKQGGQGQGKGRGKDTQKDASQKESEATERASELQAEFERRAIAKQKGETACL